jgi:hypothetical protein
VVFIQTYASIFAKEIFTKKFILNQGCISKTRDENEFQNSNFIKYFPLISKDYFENPISNFHYASKPFWPNL